MSAEPAASEFDSECFFITPIGAAGSAERKRADDTLLAIVEPSASAVGLTCVRADRIEQSGHITLQVLEHCISAKVAVADLTGGNLNVYYEVGIRHALRRPLVLIADDSAREQLPFDLLQQRTVFYTDTLEGAVSARDAVTQQFVRALAGNVDSPVQAAANLHGLQQGDEVQQTLAQLVSQITELPAVLRRSAPAGSLPLDTRRRIRDELDLLGTIADDDERRDESNDARSLETRGVAERLEALLGMTRAPLMSEGRVFPLTRIADLRREAGLTVEQLAERAGMHRTEVQKIEQGLVKVQLSTAARIAEGLGLSLSELIRLAEHGEPPLG
jgi:DNA-binding XRE family transcriptional regulator